MSPLATISRARATGVDSSIPLISSSALSSSPPSYPARLNRTPPPKPPRGLTPIPPLPRVHDDAARTSPGLVLSFLPPTPPRGETPLGEGALGENPIGETPPAGDLSPPFLLASPSLRRRGLLDEPAASLSPLSREALLRREPIGLGRSMRLSRCTRSTSAISEARSCALGPLSFRSGGRSGPPSGARRTGTLRLGRPLSLRW